MAPVESTVRAYFEALNRSDLDEVVELFAEDGSFLADEMSAATGREQIRRAFEGAFGAAAHRRTRSMVTAALTLVTLAAW